MNRRTFLKAASVTRIGDRRTFRRSFRLGTATGSATSRQEEAARGKEHQPTEESPEQILLKDYRPKSIYKIPVSEIAKARFPIIDMHSHPYAKTPEQIAEWVGNMDEVGVEKTIILTAVRRKRV